MNLLFKKLRKEVGWLRLQFYELPLEPLEEFRHQGQCVDVSPIHTIIPMDCYLTWEENNFGKNHRKELKNFICLLYTSPSPRDQRGSRMPSSA